MKRIDIEISNLCKEIDSLEREVEYWRNEHKKVSKRLYGAYDDSIKHSGKMIGMMLESVLNKGE